KLPQEVRRQGVTVEKGSSAFLQVLAFFSDDGSHNDLSISNYVTLDVLDMLKRVPGATTVEIVGAKDYAMRGCLKPDGLAQHALDEAKEVEGTVARLSKTFPKGITYPVPYDTTRFVKVSIEEVVKTLLEAMLLVIAVVFLFLQNWRATLIPVVAVPVSLIGTF